MPEVIFTNPVFPGYFADPFVLRADERYYAYGTNTVDPSPDAFEILRSDDLAHWTLLERAMPAVDGLDVRDHWAPEVAEHQGLLYLYFSAGVEDRGHALRVAIADRPEGPFQYTGEILTPNERFAIDAHPFRDDDGTWYLYYARDRLEADRVGTSLVVDRLVDMTRLAGDPLPLLTATADWQLFQRERPMYGAIYDWYTLEGPFVVKRQAATGASTPVVPGAAPTTASPSPWPTHRGGRSSSPRGTGPPCSGHFPVDSKAPAIARSWSDPTARTTSAITLGISSTPPAGCAWTDSIGRRTAPGRMARPSARSQSQVRGGDEFSIAPQSFRRPGRRRRPAKVKPPQARLLHRGRTQGDWA